MKNGNGNIHIITYYESSFMKGFVRLTKWLPGLHEEMAYLRREYLRISADPLRSCAIVRKNEKYALFVNDVTEGAFERLQENDDDDEN